MTQNLALVHEQFTPGLGRDQVARLADLKQEPAWLRDRRLEAWNVYEQTPTPTPNQRDWKYTDITRLNFDQFTAFGAPPAQQSRQARLDELAQSHEARAGLLIQHDSLAVREEL